MGRQAFSQGERSVTHITTVPESLIFLQGQCAFMLERGWKVAAVSSPGEKLERFGVTEGVDIHPIPMQRQIAPFTDLMSLLRLVRLWRTTRPTIVHAHTPKAGLLGILSAFISRVPIRIYHIHGFPVETAKGLKRRLLTWSERVTCLLSTDILAVSPSVASLSHKLGLVPDGRVRVFGAGSINGIDTVSRFDPNLYPVSAAADLRTRLGISKAAPVLGYVGRIVSDKGINELTLAWQELRVDFPDLAFVLVGDFEPSDPVADATRALLENHRDIYVTGWIDQPENYYTVMNVVALPSHREGFGLAAAEAMAMKLPVVGTKIAGLVDVIEDGVTGALVEVGDITGLVSAIRQYLSDVQLSQRHSTNGRLSVERHFQPGRLWSATADFYESALTRL